MTIEELAQLATTRVAQETESLVAAAIASGKDPMNLVICHGMDNNVWRIWLEEKNKRMTATEAKQNWDRFPNSTVRKM